MSKQVLMVVEKFGDVPNQVRGTSPNARRVNHPPLVNFGGALVHPVIVHPVTASKFASFSQNQNWVIFLL